VSLRITLLGKPAIERDGALAAPPRGRKAWALLAYVLLAERRPTRAHLASLLFAEADDPLGALRWNLAELRRVLADPLSLRGNPPLLRLPPGATVDALELLGGEGRAGAPPSPGGELLEGLDFRDSPEFELWLGSRRRQLAGIEQAAMHDAALARLAAGDPAGAAELAAALVELDPLEPRSQELLIRCLARGGDAAAAEAQLASCERLFEAELGVRVGPELRMAAREGSDPTAGAVGDRDVALGQLDAGEKAIDAGAVDPGLECLRLAAAEAAACGDEALRARSLAALGSALVHAVRGRDEEGAAVLHEALARAERIGERASAVLACRELGYIDVQAGRGAAAVGWLAKATELATTDDELSAILAVRGMGLSDRAYYTPALELLERSVELAERGGRSRQAAWSLSLVGRIHLLRGELGEAVAVLNRCLALVTAERWTAFRPWPESLRAEARLLSRGGQRADDRLDAVFRLACRLGDPCWEATAARVIGLRHAADGDRRAAREWLSQARARATRVADPYEWVHAQVLESLAALAVDSGDEDARELAQAIERFAGRLGMRELVVRAHLHGARLGVDGALAAARLLAAEIDNPVLERLVRGAVAA